MIHRLRKKTTREPQEIVSLCAKNCHGDVALMKKLDVPEKAVEAVETYKKTIHGKAAMLGSEDSAQDDSYITGLLEYPQYTRPAEYRGWAVPEVLLSGNHGEVAKWRREQAVHRTLERRPELLDRTELSSHDRELVDRLKKLNTGSTIK